MAGKRLGLRPDDFDESSIRSSPTFKRWLALSLGRELIYSSRKFVRGAIDDEERLMRRIMIRRRANKREHGCLRRARKEVVAATATADAAASNHHDDNEEKEEEEVGGGGGGGKMRMDVDAVISTRSYRRWSSLPHGTSFVYNHTYIKGKMGRIGCYGRIFGDL